MSRERRDRVIETIFQIRPGELGLASLLFFLNLSVVGTFIVGRSVRDALFLAHGTREQLPWMYIASALAVAMVGSGYARIADRARRDWLTAGSAALFALGFGLFRLALGRAGEWVYGAYYVYVEVVGALTIIQFWTLANDLYNSRDAKRLFGTIGAGGTVANIVLGGLVGVLASRIGAENLGLLCAGLLAAVTFLSLRLGHRVPTRAKGGRSRARAGASRIFGSTHLKYVAALSAITFLATTLLDFQFKSIASKAYSKDALAAFFGNFYAVTGVLALFLQFFGTSRILSRFGVIAALAILPAFLGLGSISMLMAPVLLTATFTKGSEFVFRYTINDATTQLLYLPVAANVRAGAKATIDGVIKPAAIAISGLLIIGYKSMSGSSLVPIAAASMVACVAWGVAVFRIRGHYVSSLQETLRRRRLDLEGARHHINDGATAMVLVKALESSEPQEVLNALEILPHASVANAEAHLSRLLSHQAATVRTAALRQLGQAGALRHGNAIFRLFDDPDPAVRASAIEAFCAIGRDKAVRSVRGFLKDANPRIRAAAIASMIRYGGLDGVLSAAEALKALISDPDPAMREQAARVLGEIGVRNFYQPVLELMGDPVLAVRTCAIEAAGKLKAPELVTALIYRLAREETAGAAVEALASYGAGIENTLERVLDNPLEEPAIRRGVPRVLGRLGTARAIVTLSAHLDDPDEGLRKNLYRALGRALRKRPGLLIDRKALLKALEYELSRGYHALVCAEALRLSGPPTRSTPRTGKAAGEALLHSALYEKVELCEERIFTLLAILFPDAEVELIYAGFKAAGAQDAALRRANALELLENLLDRPLRAKLFPLLEDLPREARLRAAAEHVTLPSLDAAARTRELLSDESPWVRACALYLCGERPDPALEGLVAESLEHSAPMVREASVAALEKMLPLSQLGPRMEKRANDDSPMVRERARAILQAVAASALAAGSQEGGRG